MCGGEKGQEEENQLGDDYSVQVREEGYTKAEALKME